MDRFCSEFAGRIRAALVKAMEAEEVKNSPSSFTTLSTGTSQPHAPREGCNGRVRSNILFRKEARQEGAIAEKFSTNHLYDKMEDNSNLFHTVSEWVAGSILKEVCKSRYNGRLRIHSQCRGRQLAG